MCVCISRIIGYFSITHFYFKNHFVEKAKSTGAAIALYGHTHQSVTAYDDGLHIMNPGSIAKGEYGAIDITPQGIMLLPMKI